jgi:hypothetical protein
VYPKKKQRRRRNAVVSEVHAQSDPGTLFIGSTEWGRRYHGSSATVAFGSGAAVHGAQTLGIRSSYITHSATQQCRRSSSALCGPTYWDAVHGMTGPGQKPNVLRTKACTTAPNVGEAFDDAFWHDLLECLWNRSWPSLCYGLPSFVGTGVADVLGRAVNRRAGPRAKWGPTKWAGPGRVSPLSDRFGATMWKPGSLIGAGGRPVCRYVDRADRRIISDRTK